MFATGQLRPHQRQGNKETGIAEGKEELDLDAETPKRQERNKGSEVERVVVG